MALENRKSNLQPSSVKAQQYRLQFSNLEGRAGEAIQYTQAPTTPPTQAPRASLFQGGPAPVALAAPVPQPAQSPTITPGFKTEAAVLDGNTYFTSSIGDTDLNMVISGSVNFAFMIKPEVFPTREYQVLFHAYSGSFASHSLEVGISDTTLYVTSANNGAYSTYFRSIPKHRWGVEGNGYTLVNVRKGAQFVNESLVADWASYDIQIGRYTYGMQRAAQGSLSSLDLSLTDHMSIGGTAARTGQNFSGSIAFAIIKGDTSLDPAQYVNLSNLDVKPNDIAPQVRTYTFNSTEAVETTGSLASTNVALGVTGSYSTTTGYY